MTKNITSKIANCLCGGVKIKIKEKLRHVINCHCSQCLKTHGNFAAYTSCSEDRIDFINKKTLKWYRSSKIAKRGFCSNCGASIFYKLLKSENISIAAGMFHNPTKLKTHSNIYTKGRLDYYKLDSRIPKFNRNNR
tara:strand:+ start:202 stop:609 length:408 start_codon:yes stop_codon:yes gene_type:complete